MLYEQHYVTVRKYRDRYKIVVMPGYDPDRSKSKVDGFSFDQKLDVSVSRARAKIYEYAYCNDWDWFVTKYATKDLSRLVDQVGSHMYYCSRGLNISEEYKKGFVYTGSLDFSPDYEGKHCSI